RVAGERAGLGAGGEGKHRHRSRRFGERTFAHRARRVSERPPNRLAGRETSAERVRGRGGGGRPLSRGAASRGGGALRRNHFVPPIIPAGSAKIPLDSEFFALVYLRV